MTLLCQISFRWPCAAEIMMAHPLTLRAPAAVERKTPNRLWTREGDICSRERLIPGRSLARLIADSKNVPVSPLGRQAHPLEKFGISRVVAEISQ